MTITNPYYIAYARAHGESDPDKMLERDRQLWPGGVMCGFVLWISEMKRKMRDAHPETMFRDWRGNVTDTIQDHGAWGRFLASQTNTITEGEKR